MLSQVLLFLIRLRFPLDKSNSYVLRSRYENLVVKELRKFEKIYLSLQKCKLNLTFLIACLDNNTLPNFLNFRVCNSYLKCPRVVCQIKLHKEEISIKKSRIRTFEEDFNSRKEKLKETLDIIDYTHLFCLFFTKNDGKCIIKIFILRSFLIWV